MVRAIGNDNDSTIRPDGDFTPNVATAMLPLVSAIVEDMAELNESIRAQREQLSGIESLPETSNHDSYRDELRDVRSTLVRDEEKMLACCEELNALGVTPHEPFDGSVDFPTVINRRPVSLCWRLGEDVVKHWHDLNHLSDNEDSGRKEIDTQSFGNESLN